MGGGLVELRRSDELFAFQRNVAKLALWLGLATPVLSSQHELLSGIRFALHVVGWLGKVQSSSNKSNRLLAKNGFAALMPRVHVHW